LKNNRSEFEISQSHSIVCHRPFLAAVWLPSNQILTAGPCELVVKDGKNIRASASLSFQEKRKWGDGYLIIFLINGAQCYQLDSLRQLLILRYFKNKDSLLEGRIYSALYSYPRRVIIVSYRDGDYYNIFPMDFHCLMEEANLAVFGLRTTNFTIQKIVASRKLVISDSSGFNSETIYQLGKNHSQSPPLLHDLAFGTIESELFHFSNP